MALGLLALLFAFDIFSLQAMPGVSAHECQSPGDTHTDYGDDACNQDPASPGDHATGDHVKPVFSMETYTVSIDENKPGSGTGISLVSLGRVMATHAGGDSFRYFVSDPTDYRIYPSGDLGYIGADGLDFEATGADALETDDDGRYVEITVAAAEAIGTTGPAAPLNFEDLTPGELESTGLAKVKVYVNDVEADPPAGLMAKPVVADPDAIPPVAASSTAIVVMWDKHPTVVDASSYTVRYREKKDGQAEGEGWTNSSPIVVADADGTGDADHITMATITGLKEKTDYEIQVRVTNAADDDIADKWSDTVVGETVSMPTKVKISVTSEDLESGELMVSWTNADGTMHDGGGDSKAKYKVEYGERGSFDPIQDHTLRSYETAGSSAIIQGLDNGTPYHVRVRAMNRVGMADYSDSASATPYGKPSAPHNLQVVGVNHNTLLARWEAPSDMGGYSSVSYKVAHEKFGDASTAMTIEDVGATSAVISGLEADTLYQVKVKAANPRGDSQDAAINFGRTTMGPADATVPGLVRNLSVSPVSESELSVSWNAPASDGGAAITGYSVQYRESGATNWTTVSRAGTDLSQSISGLTAGTSYEVRVAAMNIAGTGSYVQDTARTMGTPPPTVPGLVRNLSVSPVSESELSVSWNAPASDGGAAITGYSVQYRESGATNWATASRAGTDLSQSISGLTAGTSYEVRVAAMNIAGTGSYVQDIAQTMAAPVLPADPCLENLAGDMRVSGQWASGCDSIDRAGSHARFYTFTLTQESEVTITLESANADAYLFLRTGEAKSGTALNDHADDDDAGVGTNSEIRESLVAATYTIEATTYYAGETGSFTLTLSGVGTTTPPPADPCLEKLTGDMRVSGQWASGCDSMDRAGSHARFYTFTLPQESEVTVILESDDADTFLYLREGAKAKFGSALHENDDHEGSLSRSQIRETLAAGSYTIEATTYGTGETGSFTLTLSGLGAAPEPPPAEDCGETLSADGTVSGTWEAGCDSETRDGSRAFYYSFTLTEEKEVTITLESADADTFLYLREGANAKSGAALHENDDHEGSLSRSQIRETLAAGSYTIEATTYEAGETGSFTLTVTGL